MAMQPTALLRVWKTPAHEDLSSEKLDLNYSLFIPCAYFSRFNRYWTHEARLLLSVLMLVQKGSKFGAPSKDGNFINLRFF